MGAAKMLLPIAGQPMVAHVIAAARAAALAGPIVVSRPDDTALQAVVDEANAQSVSSHDHQQGMAHSLAAGLNTVPPEWRGAFILLGDMPLVSSDLLRIMARRITDQAIIIPTFEGRRGNPVLWARAHFGALAGLTGDVGGRALWAEQQHNIIEQPWHDDTIFHDIDTPDDWAAIATTSARA